MKSSLHLQIFPDKSSLCHAAAENFIATAKQAIHERGVFSAALSGGHTPRELYELIARDYQNSLDWEKVHFFWGDERNVSPTDPESNYGLAWDSMLASLPIPSANIHPVPTQQQPIEHVAEAYEMILDDFFSNQSTEDHAFDYVLLGLGEDGHTASLMPDGVPNPFSPEPETKRVISVWIPHLNASRITLTADFINLARNIVFFVSGQDKANVIRHILNMDSQKAHLPLSYPAQLIAPVAGSLVWLIDQAAGSRLDSLNVA
jgi:6-phosphogluconolactonase